MVAALAWLAESARSSAAAVADPSGEVLMSRSRSRERQRRQRLETALRESVVRARNADAEAVKVGPVTAGHGELWQLFLDIERSGVSVWEIARVMRCTEDEIAMITQVVAPRLAGMTAGSVLRRRERTTR
jgi:hypothetical protein